MELFQHVVRRESSFGAFDVWAEKDSKSWLEANRLFNFHFPLFLAELLDDVKGGDSNTVFARVGRGVGLDRRDDEAGRQGDGLVARHGKARTAAKAAKKAGKTETAKWLERLKADWRQCAAGSRASSMYGRETEALRLMSRHEANVAAGKEKRTPDRRAARDDPVAPEARRDDAGGRVDVARRPDRGQGLHALRRLARRSRRSSGSRLTAWPPTVSTPVAAVVPPGQLSVYSPGCSVSVNEPERPRRGSPSRRGCASP